MLTALDKYTAVTRDWCLQVSFHHVSCPRECIQRPATNNQRRPIPSALPTKPTPLSPLISATITCTPRKQPPGSSPLPVSLTTLTSRPPSPPMSAVPCKITRPSGPPPHLEASAPYHHHTQRLLRWKLNHPSPCCARDLKLHQDRLWQPHHHQQALRQQHHEHLYHHLGPFQLRHRVFHGHGHSVERCLGDELSSRRDSHRCRKQPRQQPWPGSPPSSPRCSCDVKQDHNAPMKLKCFRGNLNPTHVHICDL